MSRNPALTILSIGVAILAAAIVGCKRSNLSDHGWPTNERLQTQFQRQRAAFEELCALSQGDPHLWRVAPTFEWFEEKPHAPPRSPTLRELPEERRQRYRALFKKLALSDGLTRERMLSGDVILFPLFSRMEGTVDSIEKGILYSSAPLPTSSDFLTEESATAQKPNIIHRPLDGAWHLYARYNE